MLRAFAAGSVIYPVIELAYRGRTHYSMALAGGLSACLISLADRKLRGAPLWLKAAICGLGVTGIEYAIGLLFNRRHKIWDYRCEPLNLRGQICPKFTLIWCGMCGLALIGLRLARSWRRS